MTEEDFHKQLTQHGLPSEAGEASAIPKIPSQIGTYKIDCLLQKGGMSVLYLGTHPKTKEPTTIKVLHPKYLSHTEVVNRFLKEAEIIAMADHPNIVKMFGYGEWEGGLYIAMEFITGLSLRQYILQNPLSLKRALEIILDIAYALCHLHTHGVIHRDLKPENILVTESGGIKVIDFGIAQLLTEKKEEAAGPARTIGTPIYMSPEQRADPESVSYPSDIYSLGIIAYELVLGKLSHGQIHLSLMPKGIQKILHKALQPNPEDRYQDIVDFITDATAYLNSPHLQKEKKVGDRLSELSENLRQAQAILVPNQAPVWHGFEIGYTSSIGTTLEGVYCDFFQLQNESYLVLVGESSANGAEAIVYTAIMRGMVRSLSESLEDPKDLVSMLNALLVKDNLDQIFTLSCLMISRKDKLLKFLSCGWGTLWHLPYGGDIPLAIPSENLALGLEEEPGFQETTRFWQEGDTFLLTCFSAGGGASSGPHTLDESLIREAIAENAFMLPQKQAEGVLRKIRFVQAKKPPRASFVISIRF